MAAGEHLMYLVKEKNMSEYDAWNASGVLLINAAKVEKIFLETNIVIKLIVFFLINI